MAPGCGCRAAGGASSWAAGSASSWPGAFSSASGATAGWPSHLRQAERRRQLAAVDQRPDLPRPARVQVDMALAHARLLAEQLRRHERLPHLQRQRPLVALAEALRQVHELGVVAAPL